MVSLLLSLLFHRALKSPRAVFISAVLLFYIPETSAGEPQLCSLWARDCLPPSRDSILETFYLGGKGVFNCSSEIGMGRNSASLVLTTFRGKCGCINTASGTAKFLGSTAMSDRGGSGFFPPAGLSSPLCYFHHGYQG